jgi:hypothetical protein
VAKISKNGPKVKFFNFFEKCNRTKTVSNVKIAAKSLKIGQFLPILANFSYIL